MSYDFGNTEYFEDTEERYVGNVIEVKYKGVVFKMPGAYNTLSGNTVLFYGSIDEDTLKRRAEDFRQAIADIDSGKRDYNFNWVKDFS